MGADGGGGDGSESDSNDDSGGDCRLAENTNISSNSYTTDSCA